eukprot:TRINITY_DN60012_c0_g1_i4.p1 TRINITY_DN60012_c0_g1~~TRINITY_DN60012_c0_g1_i4.p1  ORF type:complete len:134 (-),score=28.98 TRINITY_DN60012_c0_g1_i4:160-561(-)
MASARAAAFVAVAAGAVDGACVHMRKFAEHDCTGTIVEENRFHTGMSPGKECTDWSIFSFNQQYCDLAGKFHQYMHMGPNCVVPMMNQVMGDDDCYYGTIMSCLPDAECDDPKKAAGGNGEQTASEKTDAMIV